MLCATYTAGSLMRGRRKASSLVKDRLLTGLLAARSLPDDDDGSALAFFLREAFMNRLGGGEGGKE
jgi:hypothetical protein